MAEEGPLDQPRLRVIADTIDAGNLDEAQHLLADLGEDSQLGEAAFYLATRILFMRGRLDAAEVAERLRDLMQTSAPFPEAERMLKDAESGSLSREPRASKPPESPPPPSQRPTVVQAPEDLTLPNPEPLEDDWIDQSNRPPLPQPSWPPPPSAPVEPKSSAPESNAAWPPKPPSSKQPDAPRSGPALAWPSIPALRADAIRKELAERSSSDALPMPEVPSDVPPPVSGTTGSDWLPQPQLPESMRSEPTAAEDDADDANPEEPAQEGAPSTPLPSVRPRQHMPTPVQDFFVGSDRASADGAKPTGSPPSGRPPVIPPAPGIPRFSPPPNEKPSYAPKLDGSKTITFGSPDPGPTNSKPNEPARERDSGAGDDQVAGRYSGFPAAQEVVWSKRRTGPPSRPAGGRARASRPGRPPTERKKIHSSAPPPLVPGTSPSLAELTRLLDEGKYTAVLEALGPDRDEPGPEHVLLKARALAQLDRRDEALATLRRFGSAPLLDPDLRANGARVLIEIGDLEAAFHQTSRAFAEAPDAPSVRLAHAWAALRLARRRDTSAMAHTAESALAGQKSREGPFPHLFLALRACIQAHVGDAERAISLAQRALAIEPQCVDAQVAIALASGRLRRAHDARQAWLRVREKSTEEAEAVAERLARLDVPLPALSSSTDLAASGEAAATLWDPMELAVLSGKHEDAISSFERLCRARLSGLASAGGDQSFAGIAKLALQTLTTAPVWQNFAPYDLSLWSVARVSAALHALYGAGPLRRAESDEFPVLALVGSYLGEVLCETHEARWEGSIMDLGKVRVVAWEGKWTPFQLLQGFFKNRSALEFDLPATTRSAHPGADVWSRRVTTSIAPPAPWDPELWPKLASLPDIGRAVSHSIISRHCEQCAGGPLDGSIASLNALDSYIALVAPTTQRAEAGAPWIPRLVVLAGAYLGEVLCEAHGAEWVDTPQAPVAPDGYHLRLPGGRDTTPLAQVFLRITGKTPSPIREYATGLLR